MMRILSWPSIRSISRLAAVALVAGGCFLGHGGPEPAISSLVVTNRSLFDVNVYVMPSMSGPATRIGLAVSSSSMTFPLQGRHLQPGGYLVVRVHAIGGRGTWTSQAVAVADGTVAVLEVFSDSYGDCSRSSLHTVPIADTIASQR